MCCQQKEGTQDGKNNAAAPPAGRGPPVQAGGSTNSKCVYARLRSRLGRKRQLAITPPSSVVCCAVCANNLPLPSAAVLAAGLPGWGGSRPARPVGRRRRRGCSAGYLALQHQAASAGTWPTTGSCKQQPAARWWAPGASLLGGCCFSDHLDDGGAAPSPTGDPAFDEPSPEDPSVLPLPSAAAADSLTANDTSLVLTKSDDPTLPAAAEASAASTSCWPERCAAPSSLGKGRTKSSDSTYQT